MTWSDRGKKKDARPCLCICMDINIHVHGVVPERLLTEISERPELLSEKIPVTIRKNHEKTW